MKRPIPAHERALARVVEGDTPFNGSPCWIFTGTRNSSGYGLVSVGSRVDRTARDVCVHRVVFEALVRPIPGGLQIDHLCRVRSCCNPDHLEVVDGRTNTLRGNSFAAVNARKTHCPQGHVYDESNTERTPKGRFCLACREVKNARLREMRAS